MIEEARKKFERIAKGESTLVDEFKDRSMEYVLSLAIAVLFRKPAREPRLIKVSEDRIAKQEVDGDYFVLPHGSSKKKIKFIEVIEDQKGSEG